MQAIATKELRGRMRGARAFVVLTVYLLLLSCMVVSVYAFVVNVVVQSGGLPPPLGRILFYAVTVLELLLLAPLAPAFGAGSIAGERERQTFDLVMTTPLSARAFVLGKLAANLSYTFLLLFVAVPVQVLALLLGGLTPAEVAIGFWLLIVAAVFYASASLFFSAVMTSTTAASVFSYLTVAMSLIGALFIFFVVGTLGIGQSVLFGGADTPSIGIIYISLVLVSLSPLTAGGLSAAALVESQGTFLIRLGADGSIPGYPGGILLLSPWVLYSLIYLTASALLVAAAVRRVRPGRRRRRPDPSAPTELPAVNP